MEDRREFTRVGIEGSEQEAAEATEVVFLHKETKNEDLSSSANIFFFEQGRQGTAMRFQGFFVNGLILVVVAHFSLARAL